MPTIKIVKNGEKQTFHFKSVFISAVAGVVLEMILLALAAWIFSFGSIDLKWIPVVSKTGMFLSALLSGVFCAKGKKNSGYLYGALTGALYTAILLVISFVTNNNLVADFTLFLTSFL
ncbi:MAG: TIGR04086 family membrane protein, partial [Clostridia bacterium]|nr:TIGR04086 family membrane protein [Clostridia bacterium]